MRFLIGALLLAVPLIAGAIGFDTPSVAPPDPDYLAGKKAVAGRRWHTAVSAFNRAVKREPANADIHNMLGYSYRHLNQMDLSFKHYNEALRINPDHLGAHEYIGIAYLKIRQPDKAKEHLASLERICGVSCEQYLDLSKAITSYR